MKNLNEPVNPEDFENQLRRQPLREVPAAWRAEILAATNTSLNTQHATRNTLSLHQRLCALLWPCPQAWASLAAVWLVILLLNYSPSEPNQVLARNTVPASPEVKLALREQRQLLAKLLEPLDQPLAEPPKPFNNRPRTECEPPAVFV